MPQPSCSLVLTCSMHGNLTSITLAKLLPSFLAAFIIEALGAYQGLSEPSIGIIPFKWELRTFAVGSMCMAEPQMCQRDMAVRSAWAWSLSS